MTINDLIAQLSQIRDLAPENGNLPVILEPNNWANADTLHGCSCHLVIPVNTDGQGPETDPNVALTCVQLSTI